MTGSSEVVHAGPAEVAPGRKRRTRWIIAGLALLLILNGFLLPLINLSSYHRSIADSLSRSLGHTVHLGSVHLAVFPLPGLAIQDLTIEEDPEFGAEPLLRAPSVTVFLRLSSLWRERLEISRIDLDDASVNITRDPSGRWNFSSLLLQASRTATAPTAQRRPSAAPRFPYIEFSDARINFKEGPEKKALSFLNADASVWLADPNRWSIRFKAQPARTDLDLDLEDAGTIRLEGSLTRATSLDQLPVDLHAEWSGAQLGQVSRLMLGSDSGWRGDLRVDTDITGDIENLVLSSRLRVSDAHRQEFTPINQLDVDARCQAAWHRSEHLLDNLTCLWPTGDGHLLLTGAIHNLEHPQPHLNLEINHTPVAFAVSLLGLLRSSLPATLDASGTINGQFSWGPQTTATAISGTTATPQNVLTGHAVADTVSIRMSGIDHPVTFAALRFITPSEDSSKPQNAKTRTWSSRPKRPAVGSGDGREAQVPGRLVLELATFATGMPTPMQVSGQLSRSGFSLHFTGESSLARLQPVARDLAQLHALQILAPKGTAQIDLTFAGPWIPPIDTETGANVPAQIEGWARLQHAELKPDWLPEPIEIATATTQFGGGSIIWANASLSVNGINARGSVSYPATCDNPAGCTAQLNLNVPTLDAAALQSALLGAGHHGELLQAILSTVESPAPPWPAVNGAIHAETLSIGTLRLNNASATIAVEKNRLNILSLDAATLGGSAHIAGSIEAALDGPKYALNCAWTGVKLAQIADLFHEKWGPGSIDGQMTLNLHGYANLASTATGDFHWIINGNWGGAWTEPSLGTPSISPGPVLPDPSPSALLAEMPSRWTAAGTISNQTLVLTKGAAQGTIGFDRKLDLDWTAEPVPVHLADSTYVDGSLFQDRYGKAPFTTPRASLDITGTLARPIAAPTRDKTAQTQSTPRAH
jgi:hypothetical protein